MSPSSLLSFFMACETIGHFEVRIIFVWEERLFSFLFISYCIVWSVISYLSIEMFSSSLKKKKKIMREEEIVENSIIWPNVMLSNKRTESHSCYSSSGSNSMRIALWSPIIYVIQIISMWFYFFVNGIVSGPGIDRTFVILVRQRYVFFFSSVPLLKNERQNVRFVRVWKPRKRKWKKNDE